MFAVKKFMHYGKSLERLTESTSYFYWIKILELYFLYWYVTSTSIALSQNKNCQQKGDKEIDNILATKH